MTDIERTTSGRRTWLFGPPSSVVMVGRNGGTISWGTNLCNRMSRLESLGCLFCCI